MLCTVIPEGAANFLHQGNRCHVADHDDDLEQALDQRTQEGFQRNVLGLERGHKSHNEVVKCGGHKFKQQNSQTQAQHNAQHHDKRGSQRCAVSLFLFFCRLGIAGGYGIRPYGLGITGRNGIRPYGLGIAGGYGIRPYGHFGCGRFNRLALLCSLLCCLGSLFGFLFAAHLLLCLFQTRNLGRAHQALISLNHGHSKVIHATHHGNLGDHGRFGAVGRNLQHDLPIGIAYRHCGLFRTSHHNAFHQRLTADRSLFARAFIFFHCIYLQYRIAT